MFQYREGTTVAIKNDMPGLTLKAGDAGTIWALYDMQPPMYEITFRASDGQDFDLTLSEEEITEVANDRRLSRQL